MTADNPCAVMRRPEAALTSADTVEFSLAG